MRHRITWGKGLNVDALPSELADGFCSNASNVRFRNGFAERVGGSVSESTFLSGTNWLSPFQSSLSSVGMYAIGVSSGNAQAVNFGSITTSITRYAEGAVISSITRVGTTATLTTATNHGLSTGSVVSIWGATPADYNGTFEITVTGVTTFTYTMAADPGASASVMGLYSYNGTIGAAISSISGASVAIVTTSTAHGLTTGDTVNVWGAVPTAYNGTFTITVSSSTVFFYTMASTSGVVSASVVGKYAHSLTPFSFFLSSTRSTGGDLNGVFILNKPESGLFYWNGDPGTRLRRIPGSYLAKASRIFKDYVIQLAPTMGGTEYPYRILWSSATEPGSFPSYFDASTTNDAGFVDKTFGGPVVDCLPLGDANIIYKEQGRIAMYKTGGTEVFSFTELPGTDGLLTTDCVVDTPVGHVFLSKNFQVLLHTGGECRNLSKGRVNSLINYSTSENFFLMKNPRENEVWVFVFNGAAYPTRALIWNWIDDTWGVFNFSSGTPITHGINTGLIAEFTNPKEEMYILTSGGALALMDSASSSTLFGSSYDSYVERAGLDLGEPDLAKNLQRSRWNFNADSGATLTIAHGSAMTADASPSYASNVTYTLGTTDYVNSRATGGKYLAVKCTWALPGSVRSTDLDITPGGRR